MFSISDEEFEIIRLTNQLRLSLGRNPLRPDTELTLLGRMYSYRMYKEKFFEHECPRGTELFDRMISANIKFNFCGENLAYMMGYKREKAVDLAFKGWVHSEGHYRNLIHPEFTNIGVGIYWSFGKAHFTQLFRTP